MRSQAPRPGLLGAQGRRRRKAFERGGKDEEKKIREEVKREEEGVLESRREGEIWWEAKDRCE